MIDTLLFGINLILSIVIWKKVLKPSIIDHHRDQLFDLREEVRLHYLNNSIPLTDESYIRMRSLINTHLRFIEKLTLVKVFCFANSLNSREDLKNYFKNKFDANFSTSSEDLNSFIKEKRNQAGSILQQYMIFSSFLLVSFLIIFSTAYIPFLMAKKILKNIQNGINYQTATLTKTSRVVTKYIAGGSDLEELSYKSEPEFSAA